MPAVRCFSAVWKAFALAQVLLCWCWKPSHRISVLEPTVDLAWKPRNEALDVRRWTQTFTGLMPPFKSWMPPKVIAQAAAWGDSVLGREAPASKEELSTLKYSFPDALPKVTLLAAHWQHAASMLSLSLAGNLHGPIWSGSPKLLSLCQQCLCQW